MFVIVDRMGKEWDTGTYSSPNESSEGGEDDRSQMIWLEP